MRFVSEVILVEMYFQAEYKEKGTSIRRKWILKSRYGSPIILRNIYKSCYSVTNSMGNRSVPPRIQSNVHLTFIPRFSVVALNY